MRLLAQHADVLFDFDTNGSLSAINAPDSDAGPPRLFLARGCTASRVWFGPDVSRLTKAACEAIVRDLAPWDGQAPRPSLYDPLRRALADEAPIEHESAGPAFRFGERVEAPAGVKPLLIDESSAHLLETHFPYTRSHLASRSPVVGAVIDGRVVAACYCARKRPSAAEAGVDTIEPYRGRGLASAVVAAWRAAAEEAGLQPLYSTSWDNGASLAVARKLRLVAYADTYAAR